MSDSEEISPDELVEIEDMNLKGEEAQEFAVRIDSGKGGRVFENSEIAFIGYTGERVKDMREFINALMENDFSEFKIGIAVERLYTATLKKELIDKDELIKNQNELINIQARVIDLMEDLFKDIGLDVNKRPPLLETMKSAKKDLQKKLRQDSLRRDSKDDYTTEDVMSAMMLKGIVDLAEKEDNKKLKAERRKKAGFKS